jgi:hypothetical protein
MKFKLLFMAMFTAAVSFACAGTSQMARQDSTSPMARQDRPMKTGAPRSYKPMTIERTDLVLGGQCVAKLTFDRENGNLTNVETNPPCRVTEEHLLMNGLPILDISDSITFGTGTQICWYDPITNKMKCVCKDRAC